MPYQITQPGGATSPAAGAYMPDAWQGRPVIVSAPAGASSYEHEIISKPDNSVTGGLSGSTTSQTATFTPDVNGGSWLIESRYTIDGTLYSVRRVVRVTKDNAGALANIGICSPAANEVPGDSDGAGGYATRLAQNDRIAVSLIGGSIDPTIPGRLTAVETASADHETRLDTAETSITTLDGRIDAANDVLDDHESRLDQLEDPPAEPSFVQPIVLDKIARVDMSGPGELVLSFAATGHLENGRLTGLVRAYTRTALRYDSRHNFSGDAFSPLYDYQIDSFYRNGRISIVAKRIYQPEVVPPDVKWAHCPSGAPATLGIKFKEACYVKRTSNVVDLSGVTITITGGGGAVTILRIREGEGTDEIWFDISRAITTADMPVRIDFALGAILDLSSSQIRAQSFGVRWRTAPYQLTSTNGRTMYRDENLRAYDPVTSGQWPPPLGVLGNTSGDAEVLQQVTAGQRPDLLANGYAGKPAVKFVPANSDFLATTTIWQTLMSSSESEVWMVCRVRTYNTNNATIRLNNGLFGAGNSWGAALKTGGGTDTERVIGMLRQASDSLWVETPSVAMQRMAPTLIHMRHKSGVLYLQRDDGPEVSIAASAVIAMGGSAFLLNCLNTDHDWSDLEIYAFACVDTDQSAQKKEGIRSYFATQPYGDFLTPQPLRIPCFYAIASVTLAWCWENWIQSELMDQTTSALSQYTFSVSGLAGSPTVNTTGVSWTPTGGDVGTSHVAVNVLLGGRIIANAFTDVVVSPAAKTGTVRLLCIGDSWTDGDIFPKRMHDTVAASGVSITTMGTRGGRIATVVAATDLFTATSHPYANGDPVDMVPGTSGSPVLPAPLVVGTTYYVRDVSGNDFKLAATLGGVAIDITTTGTGIWYVRRIKDEKNEGRAGWSAADMLGSQLAQQPGIGGQDAASPFVDPNGRLYYAFSPAYYVTTYLGGIAPTHVFVQLTVNGLVTGPPDVNPDRPDLHEPLIEQRIYEVNQIVQAWHAYDPTIHVAVLAPSAPNVRQSAAALVSDGVSVWRAGWRLVQHKDAQRIFDQFNDPANRTYAVAGQVVDTAGFDAIDMFHPQAVLGYNRVGDQGAAWVLSTLP